MAAIIFFHPDFGIGGAERLVVDAAVGLQRRGHRVVIFTNHCDKRHCFDECRDGTLDVRVRAAWLVPPSIASRLAILCAVLRHFHLILHITLSGELYRLRPRAFFVDQLSAGLPLLRCLYRRVPVLFYCHFPDLLLARGRDRSCTKRLYRIPFDWIEQWSMGFSSVVAVNSSFTKSVVARTWPGLRTRVGIQVIYPCVDIDANKDPNAQTAPWTAALAGLGKLIISINRFERKKDIGLAIKAFAAIPEPERECACLVLAGGYDLRISENVEYHVELQKLAASLDLSHRTISSPTSPATLTEHPWAHVLFLLSISNDLKAALLATAHLVVYTPSDEHFGIVPLEAMLARRPILAANSGGPVETIQDPSAGWLRDPADVPAWAAVLRRALTMPSADLARMGDEGYRRVRSTFGRAQMAEHLDTLINDMTTAFVAERQPTSFYFLGVCSLSTALVFLAVALVVGATVNYHRLPRD